MTYKKLATLAMAFAAMADANPLAATSYSGYKSYKRKLGQYGTAAKTKLPADFKIVPRERKTTKP